MCMAFNFLYLYLFRLVEPKGRVSVSERDLLPSSTSGNISVCRWSTWRLLNSDARWSDGVFLENNSV